MRTVQKLFLVVALSLLTIRPASAPFIPTTLSDLMAAKNLKCTFTSAIGINPAKPWPTTKSIAVKEVLRFDHIDHQKGTARLIAAVNIPGSPDEESTDVVVSANSAGIYFTEVAQMVTTVTFVFAEQDGNGRFKVASSRYFQSPLPAPGVIGMVAPSQEYGTCEGWK